MEERLHRVWQSYGGVIVLGAVGIPIGVAVGAIDAVFGRVLIAIGAVRDAHPFWFVPFLAAAGALIAWSYLRFGKNTGRGMSLVFDVGLGRENVIPLRLIPLIMGGTWITHLFGGSAGREGVAVQIEHPVKRIAVMGAALSVVFLLLWQGRYSGLGTNLISASFAKGAAGIRPWDWALKFALTVLTLSAGFQGGEVTPLFSIGASLGVVLGGLMGLPTALVAALGYAAVFGSATNTLLAPTFIGAEVFGFAYLPHFFVVCAVAYLFNMDKSIYALQEVGYRG